MTILLFLIMLGALVFVHELGHFLSAKRAGIRVDEFALGFPPRILSKKIGETVYALNLIPFGGYVKIFGEDGLETGTTAIYDERSFVKKPRLIQAFVLGAGVLGNVVFAWLLLSLAFMVGVSSSPEGRYGEELQHAVLTVTSVLPESPAARAGLIEGDEIISLSEGARHLANTDAGNARLFIAETEKELTLTIKRKGEERSLSLLPARGIIQEKKAIGVTLETVGIVRFGFFRAVFEGFLMTLDLLRDVAVGLVFFIGQAFMGNASLGDITGPVGIAGLVGEARTLGLIYFLSFTAFISINLAVINLLPLPALDGGRLLFLGIEAALRRPLSSKFTRILNTAGFFFLLFLMLLITYRDIMKLL